MYKVIGIISYLPDDEHIRKSRFEKLCKLIDTCNQLFGLPIHIIIQNYKDELVYFNQYKNVTLSENYTRCGIVGARKKLREWFLSTPYDCLIMLDDDCELVGSRDGALKYLELVDSHPGYYGLFKGSQLKLFYIHKSLLSQVDFVDINPENGEGFEDTLFVSKLAKKFPKRCFSFYEVKNLKETSVGVGDSLSTWYTGQDLSDMLMKTDVLKVEL
jgi:hypothetical protein